MRKEKYLVERVFLYGNMLIYNMYEYNIYNIYKLKPYFHTYNVYIQYIYIKLNLTLSGNSRVDLTKKV